MERTLNNLGYIINQAFKKGMKIIVNPSPINSAIDEIDFLKVSAITVSKLGAMNSIPFSDNL